VPGYFLPGGGGGGTGVEGGASIFVFWRSVIFEILASLFGTAGSGASAGFLTICDLSIE
jgi:hypothetical protein